MAWWSELDQFPFGDGPELADELLALILAGRVAGYRSAGRSVEVTLHLRGGGAARVFEAGHVINCTGPGASNVGSWLSMGLGAPN